MRCETCHRDAPSGAAFCPYCGETLRAETKPEAFEYAAFISYRHLPRDQEVAKRVQQSIETYRLPRSVSHYAGDGRLGKCFRDEDELAAASSLPDRILEALAKSSALVVICTPATKESAWIRREVAAFVEMHGRDRVFTVLADGSSAESIPDYLRIDSLSTGVAEDAHSSPLAADLRPEASGKTREEMLRLIAAIADCGFDDLRQRDRTRKRKKTVIAAFAVVLVIAAIGAAIMFAISARNDALADESRRLAAESEQLLAQGDRYGALEKALGALPKSESSSDRPYVAEARTALEDALVIEYIPDRLWIPCYALDADTAETKMAICPDKGWFALLKPDMTVDVYETLSGRRLSSADLRASLKDSGMKLDGDLDNWTLLTAGDYLVVAERTGNCMSFCVEAASGDVTWAQDLAINAIAVSPENSAAVLFLNDADGGMAGTYRIPEGTWTEPVEFRNAETPHFAGILPSVADENAGALYVGFDNAAGKFDLVSRKSTMSEPLGGSIVLSLALAGNAVITTSVLLEEPLEDIQEPVSAKCTITALDKTTMRPLWSHDLQWEPKPFFTSAGYVNAEQNPRATELGSFGEPSVICVAGSLVEVYAISDGALIYEHDFPETVVGAQAYSKRDGYDYLNVACADGTVYFTLPIRGETPKTPVSFSYPGAVGESATFWDKGANILSVGHSLENPERYFVYRTEYRTADTAKPPSEYTLDELIALAHKQLDAVAQ